jgi:hypothetical protein
MAPRSFILALLAAFAATGPAAADGKTEVRYAVSFGGISVGQGALVIEVTNDGYSASGSGAVTGMLQILAPGKGTAAARGRFAGGKVLPATFSTNSESGEKWEDIRLTMQNGTVKEATVLPPRSSSGKDRVKITDEHLKNVVDPMSAALMPVPGSGSLSGPEACNRTIAIYDGRIRYNLVMTYDRAETMKDIKGVSGPLAVCKVNYVPVAGHREGSKAKKPSEQNIYVWLAPVADTRVLVPAKVTIGAPVGTLTVQATQFTNTNGREAKR